MAYFDEGEPLTAEELTELRVERYGERERFYASMAIFFTVIVFAFGPNAGADARIWLSGLAGGLFVMAGLNRLMLNIALARRG